MARQKLYINDKVDIRSYAKGAAACAVALALCIAGYQPAFSDSAPAPTLVEVATATQGNLSIYREWIATLDGSVNASIRAQVSGYLIAQNYHEGESVKKGDLLFEIDPRPFQAILDQANGALAQSQARYGKTLLDVKRYAPLVKDRAISREEYDNAVQANLEAQAAVISAKATVEQAQLNLEFTKIKSPIDGSPSFAKAQLGDLVGPTNGELTTVSTIDPIKVYFSITEQEYLTFAAQFTTDRARDEQIKQVEAELVLPDGTVYPSKGKILAIDRSIGVTTGALRVEALFPNSNNSFRPGQFGRVRIKANADASTITVPCRALTELQGSYQVAVVGADSKIHIQPVRPGEHTGNQCIIQDGLKAGDRVVVEGLQKIADGMAVTARNSGEESPSQKPPEK